MVGDLGRLAEEARRSGEEFNSELAASDNNEPRRKAAKAAPRLPHPGENGDKPLSNGFKRGGAFELGEQDVSDGVGALRQRRIGSSPVSRWLRRHQLGDRGEIDDESRSLNSLLFGRRWEPRL